MKIRIIFLLGLVVYFTVSCKHDHDNLDTGYQIGDYYPDPNVTFHSPGVVASGTQPVGIVFWVNPTDHSHGKVVSLDEKKAHWSTIYSASKATDVDNGLKNMAKIKIEDNTFSVYPAFAWIHLKNKTDENYNHTSATGIWYLPSKNELKRLFASYSGMADLWDDYLEMPNYNNSDCVAARNAFDRKLEAAGGNPFTPVFYWSSSEGDNSLAWEVDFRNGNTTNLNESGRDIVRSIFNF